MKRCMLGCGVRSRRHCVRDHKIHHAKSSWREKKAKAEQVRLMSWERDVTSGKTSELCRSCFIILWKTMFMCRRLLPRCRQKLGIQREQEHLALIVRST